MVLQLDFNAFKNSPLPLQDGTEMLGIGGQGVVLNDRGTALKLYTALAGTPYSVMLNGAQKEYATLDWLARHNDTGIKTPRPIEFVEFAEPVHTRLGNEAVTFLAALRMEKMNIVVPGYGLNWHTDEPEQGSRFYRNLGGAIAAFNNLGERKPLPEGLIEQDPLPAILKVFADRGASRFVPSEDIYMMLNDHARLTAGQKPAGLMHGDLHQRNVSYDPRTQEITTVYDWGCAMQAHRGRDLHHFTGAIDIPAVHRRNELVQEGFNAAITNRPDPTLTTLYALMQRARMIVGGEAAMAADFDFNRFVVQPYNKTMADYRVMRQTIPTP